MGYLEKELPPQVISRLETLRQYIFANNYIILNDDKIHKKNILVAY